MPDEKPTLSDARRQLDAVLAAIDGLTADPSARPQPAPPPAPAEGLGRSLTRLLVGSALLTVDDLAQRVPEWERAAAPIAAALRAGTPPPPLPEAAPPDDPTTASFAPVAGDPNLRYALVGWLFETQAQLWPRGDPRRWLDTLGAHTLGTLGALLHLQLPGRPAQAGPPDAEIARWIELGREEEPRSRALALVALHALVHDSISSLAVTPAVEQLVQQQSSSLAGEMLEEVREHSVSGDTFVEALARSLLRRPPRSRPPSIPEQRP